MYLVCRGPFRVYWNRSERVIHHPQTTLSYQPCAMYSAKLCCIWFVQYCDNGEPWGQTMTSMHWFWCLCPERQRHFSLIPGSWRTELLQSKFSAIDNCFSSPIIADIRNVHCYTHARCIMSQQQFLVCVENPGIRHGQKTSIIPCSLQWSITAYSVWYNFRALQVSHYLLNHSLFQWYAVIIM